ncbi:MAG: hypothetical protein ACXWWX_04860, partial [Actinomycetota bacterium]
MPSFGDVGDLRERFQMTQATTPIATGTRSNHHQPLPSSLEGAGDGEAEPVEEADVGETVGDADVLVVVGVEDAVGVGDGSSVGVDVEELEEDPSPEVDDGSDGSGSSDGVGSSLGSGASDVGSADGVGSSVGRGEIEMVGSVTERLTVGRPLKVGSCVGRSPEQAAMI